MTAAYGPSRFERRADRCPLCGTPVGDPHESADCPSGDYDGDARAVLRGARAAGERVGTAAPAPDDPQAEADSGPDP